MKIKIKYHVDIIPIKHKTNSDWVDLRAAEDIYMCTGEHKYIPLGVSMELPEGYEAHVVPRSSTYKNFGIIQANHCGIIDESYCGDDDRWYMSVISLKGSIIKKNDRICQFRIIKKQPQIDFEVVDSLENDNRGGLGSTGVK